MPGSVLSGWLPASAVSEPGLARGVGRAVGLGLGGAGFDEETADARDSSLAGDGMVGRAVVIVPLDGFAVPDGQAGSAGAVAVRTPGRPVRPGR